VVANLLGDEYPEIVIRSGYVFPGTGRERVHVLDRFGNLVPGWPIETPTDPSRVFSTPFAPMIDDIDGDGLVEMILVGEGLNIFVWDFDASYKDGKNRARLLGDNLNSSIYPARAPLRTWMKSNRRPCQGSSVCIRTTQTRSIR